MAKNDDTLYEMICDNCGEEYTISTYKTEEIPTFCPFCGNEIDVSDFDEEDQNEDEEDTLDFDDDH